ncbi:hypothetical protein BDZ97DRAFT_1918129 [Flammula alnicola]|nr:hypothetical protein BDZ97DRAFT_1918129 [Flammula alnicola]
MDVKSIPQSLHISRLPFELEREIFEIAASSFPQCIPTLVVVARRVRVWFEPELYRIVRSGEGRVIPPLYAGTGERHTRNTERDIDIDRLRQFGPWVKHILLQNRTSGEIKQVLEFCPNVHNLALWIIHGSCTHLVPILEKLPLRRFSFDPTYFFENYAPDLSIPFDQPLFHNLTHLEIINATSSWSKWRQLALLPKLTHLALAGIVNQHLIDRVIVECASLEVFVMFYADVHFIAGELSLSQKDPRVVLLQSVLDHLDHWETGARGEEDFWITAEKRKQEAREKAASRLRDDYGGRGLGPDRSSIQLL